MCVRAIPRFAAVERARKSAKNEKALRQPDRDGDIGRESEGGNAAGASERAVLASAATAAERGSSPAAGVEAAGAN